MRYLSLFSGIEAATQAWKPLGWECVAVSEIEPFPCAVLEHYYPDVPNLGDVTKITEQQIKDLGQIDLVVFGSPCFVADTTVITKDGIKPIEQVAVGDEVLTHNNHFKPVLRVGGKPSQPVYKLKISGAVDTTVTGEHPYYVRKMTRKWCNEKRSNYRHLDYPTWVEAAKLKKNDFVALPALQLEENPLGLTDEECYIIGRYIADGHTVKHYRTTEGRPNDRHWQVILSVGSHKVSEFQSHIKDNHFSCYQHTENVHRIIFSNKRLVEIVEAHCGCGAINKELSITLLNLPKDKLAILLDGYMSGDGYRVGLKHISTTISQKLALSIQLAVAKVYNTATMTNLFKRPATTVIEGRTVNQNDTITLAFYQDAPKQANYIFEDGLLWVRFKSIELLEEHQDVYNLEVADDNSYTANNVIVHNCQNLSVAGNRKGLDGAQSGLFYDSIRIIQYAKQHCGARFALWENVPGAFSSNKGADFTQVVKHMAGLDELDTPTNGWGKEGAALGANGLLEWSVLDAQWFGLAQRRKRVFALVDFGDWQSRPPILLEPKSLRGDTPPSRETGQSSATDAETGFRESSFGQYAVFDTGGTIKASGDCSGGGSETLVVKGFAKQRIGEYKDGEVASTCAARDYKDATDLVAYCGTQNDALRDLGVEICPTLRAGHGGGAVNPMVRYAFEPGLAKREGSSCRFNYECSPTLRANMGDNQAAIAIAGNIIGRTEGNGGNGNGFDDSGACYTLTTNDRHAVAYPINTMNCQERPSDNGRMGLGVGSETDPYSTLFANHSHAVAYGIRYGAHQQDTLHSESGVMSTLPAGNNRNGAHYTKTQIGSVVRRLTPIECERLQGFPDNFTKIPYRGKDADECPTGARYKALGNSMAVSVMRWIGEQIDLAVNLESNDYENK